MLTYPNIDPVLFSVGPLEIRWYSLAYIAGIVLGCMYGDYLNRKKQPTEANLKCFDDFMVWVIMGIVLGGRLGYVLFYNFSYYMYHPIEALAIWQGGMSFHGGFIGVVIAVILFCRKYNVSVMGLLDLAACSAPIGLFFGRIANFINGELFGRTTTAPIGMIFPDGGALPRHPSQLYEAVLEGIVVFAVLFYCAHYTKAKEKPGLLGGIFLVGYGISRIIVENFREPDSHLGYLFGYITRGQLLSIPMILVGAYFILSRTIYSKSK